MLFLENMYNGKPNEWFSTLKYMSNLQWSFEVCKIFKNKNLAKFGFPQINVAIKSQAIAIFQSH